MAQNISLTFKLNTNDNDESLYMTFILNEDDSAKLLFESRKLNNKKEILSWELDYPGTVIGTYMWYLTNCYDKDIIEEDPIMDDVDEFTSKYDIDVNDNPKITFYLNDNNYLAMYAEASIENIEVNLDYKFQDNFTITIDEIKGILWQEIY